MRQCHDQLGMYASIEGFRLALVYCIAERQVTTFHPVVIPQDAAIEDKMAGTSRRV
jgi:hypothetical protein